MKQAILWVTNLCFFPILHAGGYLGSEKLALWVTKAGFFNISHAESEYRASHTDFYMVSHTDYYMQETATGQLRIRTWN
jgi:hypothetical protein